MMGTAQQKATRTRPPGAKLPVPVWIHGGSFVAGSGAVDAYNGEGLASKGVVIVTINYRLGIFGFVAHPELSGETEQHVSGNYGLLDQIAALEWVHRNISAFGVDPANDRRPISGRLQCELSRRITAYAGFDCSRHRA